MKQHPLPFFDERKFNIDLLVLHSYAGKNFFDSCERHKVSAHYLIDLKGELIKIIDEEKRAWHAGAGSWREFKSDINSRSIGIEVQNKTLGQTPFTAKQMETLINLSKKIIKKYRIEPRNIVGHSDVAPTRKPDPGFKFPWKKLAQNNIGLWYDLRKKHPETDIEKLLESIGYSTENLKAAAYAFCRRFLPEFVRPDLDIGHLINNVLPDNFDFMKEAKFLKTLQAVAYRYRSIK